MEEIKLANNLIQAREMLRMSYPDIYDVKSKFVQGIIRNVMAAQGIDVLRALLVCMVKAKEKGRENDNLWFSAAACDMIIGQQPHESISTRVKQLAEALTL